MDQIRFSQPTRVEPPKEVFNKKSGVSVLSKNIFKALGLVVVLGLFVYGGILIKDRFWGGPVEIRDVYSAVFLTNGQVYFGKMVKNDAREIILNDVYYLQVNSDSASGGQTNALSQSTFNLVKLGNELHGPTDELFVNKEQVIFYEYLRDDSRVVQSIKNYK